MESMWRGQDSKMAPVPVDTGRWFQSAGPNMTSRSSQYTSIHWNVCSNHSAISDFGVNDFILESEDKSLWNIL